MFWLLVRCVLPLLTNIFSTLVTTVEEIDNNFESSPSDNINSEKKPSN